MKRTKRWFLYLVRCCDGSLYTGIALDVEKRFREHSTGKGSKYLRSKLPIELVYRKSYPNHSAALKKEAAIKNWTRQQKQALIAA